MPEQLWFTEFLNRHLHGVVTSVLELFHIHPRYPEAPITNFVAMEILVFLILVTFFILVRTRLSVDRPGALQHTAEFIGEFVAGQCKDVIGHGSEIYVPYIATIGLFILVSNLIGIVPGFESPTANPAVPLGCAVCTFVYYHFHGIRKQGATHYAKHFLGPVWWMSPLMLPIELVGHLARLLSLTIRLFANIFAGDIITMVFFSIVPIALPALFLGLHILVSLLQTYIFMLLTLAYVSVAVAEEH
jgi:F-type H+-transporting ATPase subunit a